MSMISCRILHLLAPLKLAEVFIGMFCFILIFCNLYSFIVSSTSRNLFLRADTLQTMEMWVRAIQMHADLARGGDGTHLISAASPNVAAKRSKKHGRSLEEALEKSIRDLEALEKQANCNSGSAANTASIVHPSPGPATSQDAITSTHTGDSLDSCGDLHVYTFDGRRSVSNADASSPPRLSHQDGVYSPPPVYNMENIVERFDYDLPSPPNKSQSARMAGRPGKAIPVKCKSEAWA